MMIQNPVEREGMTMGTSVELPEINLGRTEIKILLAVKLFEDGVVSLGKAAEIAGYSERTFAEMLIHQGVPPIRYEGFNVDSELRNA